MRKAQRTGSRLAGAVVLLCALSLIAAGLLFGGSGRWQTASPTRPETQLTNQPSADNGGSNVRSVTPTPHPSARSAKTSTPAGRLC